MSETGRHGAVDPDEPTPSCPVRRRSSALGCAIPLALNVYRSGCVFSPTRPWHSASVHGGGPLELPTLSGDRVRLRAFRYSDASAIIDASSDRIITAVTTVPAECDETGAAHFVDRQHQRAESGAGYSYAITDHDDGAVGQIGVWLRDIDQGRASVGYWVAPHARRRGYAVDALRVVTGWSAQIPGLHRLHLFVEPWNEGSWRTAERAGCQREGLLRSWEAVDSERRDMFVYSVVVDRPGGGR